MIKISTLLIMIVGLGVSTQPAKANFFCKYAIDMYAALVKTSTHQKQKEAKQILAMIELTTFSGEKIDGELLTILNAISVEELNELFPLLIDRANATRKTEISTNNVAYFFQRITQGRKLLTAELVNRALQGPTQLERARAGLYLSKTFGRDEAEAGAIIDATIRELGGENAAAAAFLAINLARREIAPYIQNFSSYPGSYVMGPHGYDGKKDFWYSYFWTGDRAREIKLDSMREKTMASGLAYTIQFSTNAEARMAASVAWSFILAKHVHEGDPSLMTSGHDQAFFSQVKSLVDQAAAGGVTGSVQPWLSWYAEAVLSYDMLASLFE